MMVLKIGPGGTAGLGYEDGLRIIHELGLKALEVEFTYGVRMSNANAKAIGMIAKGLGISLSVHAPYYINLASDEKEKVTASKQRIMQSCERAHHLGAKCVVFHAAFYQKKSQGIVFQQVKDEIVDLMESINEKGYDMVICPETTGKPSQFGDLDELLKLSKETGCGLCIDFSHLYARSNGKIDFDDVAKKIKESSIKRIHSHFSGIEYTEKGEKRHLPVTDDFFLKLAKPLVKYGISGTIICEAPDPINDAVKMKRLMDGLIS